MPGTEAAGGRASPRDLSHGERIEENRASASPHARSQQYGLARKERLEDYCEYEAQLNRSIMGQPMAVLCTYSLMTSGAAELLDVARNHEFAIATRHGSWQVIETTQLKRARSRPWRR
jgi:hypothetical protein